MIKNIRNVAIIAHVDHGKTTLVDQLLQQSGTLNERQPRVERVMDSNTLEKERGITILSKNTAIEWHQYRINIVDTPGHADFGGEVERILSMVDAVLLLVDAVEGPMPQTRFVTQKAFSWGLKPIVVVNKMDREGARPNWVIDQVFDLFVSLEGSDEQLDFPIVYASALRGVATRDLSLINSDAFSVSGDSSHSNFKRGSKLSMTPLFETILESAPAPQVDSSGPFQMQISSLDYSSYVGAIGIGRIKRGHVKTHMPVTIIDAEGRSRRGRVLQVLGFMGLERVEVSEAKAGDIIAITGIEGVRISDTLCDPHTVEALPALLVDEPTVSMTFSVNNSPLSGQEGKFLTSRQIRERLDRELMTNVALRVDMASSSERFIVSGRGELHLGILIETMRREGYELAVSRPEVITKVIDEQLCEPYEILMVDIEATHQGALMEEMARRLGDLKQIVPDGKSRVQMEYLIPTRGLIGLHARFLTLTSGTGLMHHVFSHYALVKKETVGSRSRGVLIANSAGRTTAYALWGLQERGELFVGPQFRIYEGMIVGMHTRSNDLVVNVTREKQLTNIRAAGSDDNILLTPPTRFSLEQAMSFIAEDELLEVTPAALRLRKKQLKESERRQTKRKT